MFSETLSEILNISMKEEFIHSTVLIPSSLAESGECGLVLNNHNGHSLWIQSVNTTECELGDQDVDAFAEPFSG